MRLLCNTTSTSPRAVVQRTRSKPGHRRWLGRADVRRRGPADHVDLIFDCPVPRLPRRAGAPRCRARPGCSPLSWPPCGRRSRGGAGHGEDPQGGRRRPLTFLDAGRSLRPRAPPRSPCTPAPRPTSTPARPTGRPSPGCGRRSRRSRCSATATSGRPRTPSDAAPRPGATASSSAGPPGPAVAVPGPRAASWDGPRRGCARAWAGSSSARCAGTPKSCSTTHYGEELRACRDIRKHIAWYLKGYPVGVDRAQPARPRRRPPGAGRPHRHDGPRRTVARRRRRGPAGTGRVAARRGAARELAALARARRRRSGRRSPRPS